MLTEKQEKLIISLRTKKGREKSGLCLIEGSKAIETAGNKVEYTFSSNDTKNFKKLVTTETPQDTAAVAKIPKWNPNDICSRNIIVVLDGVQDPGNVGSILRLCLGFDASLILINSTDVSSPKVIRSSTGAMFQVPWMHLSNKNTLELIKNLKYPVYRLEKKRGAKELNQLHLKKPLFLIVGSEGRGIQTLVKGNSIFIDHNQKLESLNVTHALAIVLNNLRSKL